MKDFYQVSYLSRMIQSLEGVIIPAEMRQMILERIHDGHQGLVKYRERANQSVWCPKMSEQITTKVQQCVLCIENNNTERKEPPMSSELPSRLWQKVTKLAQFIIYVSKINIYRHYANSPTGFQSL